MGKKGGKFKKKENTVPVKNKSVQFDDEDMTDDEIDAFHKNRDVVPLNIGDDMEGSDEDNEHPVFDFEMLDMIYLTLLFSNDYDDKDEDEDEDEDDEDINDEDNPPKGLEAKIIRTQKYMRDKFGGVEDEQPDDDDEEDEKGVSWIKRSNMHGTDVGNELQESDEEDAAEEEAETKKITSAKAKYLSMEDFGFEDASLDESDREPTFEEILDHGKPTAKASLDKGIKDEDGTIYEIVTKDLNALTKEEQIEIVYSSAPELIGLLSELNDALDQLENKVNPLVDKIKGRESAKKGEMHYLEVKQLLLQSFCQAITFYLLLKSEGQPVRDHPVVSRLVEIKSLLDKVKEIDEKLPFDIEDIVNKDVMNNVTVMNLVEENAVLKSDCFTNGEMLSMAPSGKQEALVEPVKAADTNISRTLNNTEAQHKQQDKQVGSQSTEMLKTRAFLEDKLKQKGLLSSTAPKNGRIREHGQPVNRQLETLDDFVDEDMELDGLANGRNKISQQLTLRPNKRKVISGDDDLPRRDDIGERRRKHELRVLAGAGINSGDDVKDDETANLSSDEDADVNGESDSDQDLELYNQVAQNHAAKRAAKSDKYSRTVEVSSLPADTVIDGKRQITKNIDKNRGLTRSRNKEKKNPRKNYRVKHKKADMRRKGQVREVRKPTGPYGGEASGINAGISHSRKFNN
ncbi:something about silencing protein 10 [Phtheirospermum japonicum]|uniref:Something about silencing protein 10 n=1 Tax=Phtheirospermum japonicum TaxID=374723 RepID=A0A830CM75_9LAMI|nr:something about silencing protein 10 [Phtheirospermum japonicum]